jgi:hypothetical protein
MKFFIYLLLSLLLSLSGLSQAAPTTNQGEGECDLDANGAIIPQSSYATDSFYPGKSCYTGGVKSWIETAYKVGLCKSLPTVGDESLGTTSDFSSCFWMVDSPGGFPVDIASPNLSFGESVMPPAGSYAYTVLISSNVVTRKASVTFKDNVRGKNGSEGKVCYTNGTSIISAGKYGPYFGGVSIKDQSNPNNLATGVEDYSAATCGSSDNAVSYTQNTQYYDTGNVDATRGSFPSTYGGTDYWFLAKGDVANPSSLTTPFVKPEPTNSDPHPVDVGVKYSIGIASNPMTVIANQSRGNLTCSTSGFNIHINLNKGNTVNVFSSQGVASSTFDPSAGDYLKVLNMKLGMADAWFATEEQCF